MPTSPTRTAAPRVCTATNENTRLERLERAISASSTQRGSQSSARSARARLAVARRRQDVRAARDHPGAGRSRHPRPGLLQGRRPALHQGDLAAARLRAARRGRRIDLGRDPLARRPRWSATRAIGPEGWGFWRVVEQDGTYFSAAYEDGDLRVVLDRSTDGAQVEGGSGDLRRLRGHAAGDRADVQPLGQADAGARAHGRRRQRAVRHQGRLRTKVCWAKQPYRTCSAADSTAFLDGGAWWLGPVRSARKHLPGSEIRKRTACRAHGNLGREPPRSASGRAAAPETRSYAGSPASGPVLNTGTRAPAAELARGFRRPDRHRAKLDLSGCRSCHRPSPAGRAVSIRGRLPRMRTLNRRFQAVA